MKYCLIVFLTMLLYMMTQQRYYKRERERYIDTYNKVQKKIVRMYIE